MDNLGTGSHRPDDLRQNASQQGQADGQRGGRLFADENWGLVRGAAHPRMHTTRMRPLPSFSQGLLPSSFTS